MVEIMVRFENLQEKAEARESTPTGSVVALGDPQRPPIHFDGWLQLLSILENLSAPAGDASEPPLPLPGTPHQ